MAIILKIIIFFFLFTQNAFAFDWIIQGVNLKWFSERKPVEIVIGAVTALVVHEASHIVTAKLNGHSIDLDWNNGPYIFFSGNADDNYAWDARSGFMGEIGVGLILNLLPITRGSDFVLGYTGSTTARTLFYRTHLNSGDFHTIQKNGGDSQLEWDLTLGASVVNIGLGLYNSTNKNNADTSDTIQPAQ
jgi:hypothetical protein